MRRYLETFFRHPWLYVLPFVVVLAGAAALAVRAARTADPYEADATVAVNLDPTRDRVIGDRPPSQEYADLLGELMETDDFVVGALQQTGLAPLLDGGAGQSALVKAVQTDWRQSIVGPNTMKVTYRCPDAEHCVEVVAAVLASFRDQVAAARMAEKTAAVEYYQRQVQSAEERMRGIPTSDPSYLPARQTYETLLTHLIDAGLDESLAAQADQAGFKILSPPRAAVASAGKVRAIALPLTLGLAVGLGLLCGSVAFATWMDRTVRTPNDVVERLGLASVAVLPHHPTAPNGGMRLALGRGRKSSG